MILEATPKNIDWLLSRLYDVRRTLQSNCIDVGHNPTFVMLTKNKEDRNRVETILYQWFYQRYGVSACQIIEPSVNDDVAGVTAFMLAEPGCRLVLMDI